MIKHEYFVYTYQYNDMKNPTLDAMRIRSETGSVQTIDFLPPTVIDLKRVKANNKKDAIKLSGLSLKALRERIKAKCIGQQMKN